MTPAEFDELQKVMAESGRSQSEVIRRGVQIVIQEHREKHDRATKSSPEDPA